MPMLFPGFGMVREPSMGPISPMPIDQNRAYNTYAPSQPQSSYAIGSQPSADSLASALRANSDKLNTALAGGMGKIFGNQTGPSVSTLGGLGAMGDFSNLMGGNPGQYYQSAGASPFAMPGATASPFTMP